MSRSRPRRGAPEDSLPAGPTLPGRRRAALHLLAAPWLFLGAASPVAAGEADAPRSAPPCCGPITPQARALLELLDHSGVQRLWRPHTTVDWFSGEPRPTAPGLRPLASHCSAFAASMAARLHVELPHPPQHAQALLANVQAHWLAGTPGREAGWREVGLLRAQELANQGWLVVAAFASPVPRRPGHIALVRPGLPDRERLWAAGPDISQAGAHNWLRVSTARGFAQHHGAWKPGATGGLRFYAHAVDWALPEAQTPPDAVGSR